MRIARRRLQSIRPARRPPVRWGKRVARAIAAGVALAGVSYGVYVVRTWLRYGQGHAAIPPDPLLDHFLPNPEVRECHETGVAAPAATTYAAARVVALDQSPVVRAIFRGRELLMGATPRGGPQATRPFLEQMLAIGWGLLADVPGRKLVFGAVTQPWRADVVFRSLPPEMFANFAEPGYTKIVWTVEVEPLDPGTTIFRTKTRVSTTDANARARFRRYWAFLSPGILLIRRETLRLVKREAERRAQSERRA